MLCECVSRCLPTRGAIALAIEAREDVKLAQQEALEKIKNVPHCCSEGFPRLFCIEGGVLL